MEEASRDQETSPWFPEISTTASGFNVKWFDKVEEAYKEAQCAKMEGCRFIFQIDTQVKDYPADGQPHIELSGVSAERFGEVGYLEEPGEMGITVREASGEPTLLRKAWLDSIYHNGALELEINSLAFAEILDAVKRGKADKLLVQVDTDMSAYSCHNHFGHKHNDALYLSPSNLPPWESLPPGDTVGNTTRHRIFGLRISETLCEPEWKRSKGDLEDVARSINALTNNLTPAIGYIDGESLLKAQINIASQLLAVAFSVKGLAFVVFALGLLVWFYRR